MVHRPPRDPRLRGLVKTLWASAPVAAPPVEDGRERVLPTGDAHLAFRLSGPPLRLHLGDDDLAGRTVGSAVVGGARAQAYVRSVPGGVASVGAQLAPGAASALLGVPGGELAGRHTALADLWGSVAMDWSERLADAASPDDRVNMLEALLASRLREPAAGVAAWALERLQQGASVGEVVGASGYSHRHFLSLFRKEVGLAPKVHLRVLRFQGAVAALAAGRPTSLAAIAQAAGYADQAHLTREFRDISGVTPGRFRAVAPHHPNHLPLVNFVQDPRPSGREDRARI